MSIFASKEEKEKKKFELQLASDFLRYKDETRHDLLLRKNGVEAKGGATGYQLAGYTSLERFYRGDQWGADEPAGASQRTDNYCAVIVDSISSLPFDEAPEIHCPTDDPSDEELELKAEAKERLILRVWEDNDYEVQFDEWSKTSSTYGDGFIKGPWAEKNKKGKWEIKFANVQNPGQIRPIYADTGFKKLLGFIDTNRISLKKAIDLYGDAAESRGVKIFASPNDATQSRDDVSTYVPMVDVDEYWTDEIMAVFVNDKLVSYFKHNWGFVPLYHVKNIFIPNHPFGKSDLEDILDPQKMHNRVNNDLANLLKWISTVNLWGKNIEGMQALVAGLSRIYSVPEDGEIHAFEKPGDPYVTNTFVQQRRSAVIELSGVSEAMMSTSQLSASSGRALAMAFQGTIRKLKPRIKRFASSLQELNRNILQLYEIYYPETKKIIQSDYRNKVYMPVTLLRNIVDTINKLQSGIISLDTAQREAGVSQPKLEQKVMKKNLSDPMLGGQIARQPALLPRLGEGQNQPGEAPMPGPGQRFASQGGAVAANNQTAGGASPVPVE